MDPKYQYRGDDLPYQFAPDKEEIRQQYIEGMQRALFFYRKLPYPCWFIAKDYGGAKVKGRTDLELSADGESVVVYILVEDIPWSALQDMTYIQTGDYMIATRVSAEEVMTDLLEDGNDNNDSGG